MHSRYNSSFRPFQCAIALGFALAVFSGTASADYGLTIVNLKNPKGQLRGVETPYGYKFLGIPYAAPPERWQPPQPYPGWDGFRDASQFGPNCAQPPTPFGMGSVDEDCLYLNVYRPRGLDEKAPVMVYIHGGSLLYGLGDDYVPIKLVEQGIVVVTINYRLGALGYLAHPALSAASPTGVSGNYGLMDQQAALRWVQENIKRFGGDPDNVTVFGESAGGHSVLAHLTSPGSAGLFHRAIVQSGAYALQQPTLAQWEYVGLGVIGAAGCPDQDLECMLALPVEALLTNQDPGGAGYLTVVDGQLMPVQTGVALATGQFNQVPIMDGTTRDEFMLFVPIFFDFAGNPVTAENYFYAISGVLAGIPIEQAAAIGTYYYPLAIYDDPAQGVGAVGTDVVFSCPSLGLLNMVSQYVPTYAYEFNDPNAPQIYLPPVPYTYGAYHESEVQYVMDTRRPIPIPYSPAFTPEQEALSDTMVTYWAQFAHYGDPNAAGEPVWSPYNPAMGQVTLQSLEPVTTQPITVMDFAAFHRCEFWASL